MGNTLYEKLTSNSIYINPGSFLDYGGWVPDTQFISIMGTEYLLAHGLGQPVLDARTKAIFPETGEYLLWVYTKDWVAHWKTGMAPGLYKVAIGGYEIETTFGDQGKEWHWQFGGPVAINEMETEIALKDLTGFEGRCGGLFFTKNKDFTPPSDLNELIAFKKAFGQGNEKCVKIYDLLVAGGGMSGMCAALMAARSGLKTALVHDRLVFGGNNSSEVRVWLGGETNFEPFPKLGDMVKEFQPEKEYHYGPMNTAEIYEDGKRLAILNNEPNLDLYTGYFISSAEMEGANIKSAELYNIKTGAYINISAALFADCTGDGNLGCFAGAHYETSTNGHMGMTNVWHIEEADTKQAFPSCPWAIDLSSHDFPGRKDIPNVYGETRQNALGCWYWESGMEHPPIEAAEYARDTNFRAMYGAMDAVKNTDADYENYYLKFAAYIGGRRESRRLLGDIVLSKCDVFNEIKFPDGIVPTTWNFDVHYPDRQFYAAFHEGDAFLTKDYHEKFPGPYFVPYRCLYSRNIGNLFMAGRDVSVTHDALGSVRVMRTGGMMGEVVGAAAAICIKHGTSPRGVYESHLPELFGKFV